jgi:hypothetical protein
MAQIAKENDIPCRIIAVDTWLGAPEFWTWGIDDPTRGLSLRRRNGYPTVYETFVKNMKKLGHDDVVAPLPLSSDCAASVLKYYDIRADAIYVDAAHEYASVKNDIDTYYELLKDGGMLFGDDYDAQNWPGVVRAVDEKFEGRASTNLGVWSILKG